MSDALPEEATTETPEAPPKRPRGRPRTRPDLDATPADKAKLPLVTATIPFRILARIRKQGPMGYSEIASYIAGSRMIRRDKYIDPAIYSLRRRGYIELSRFENCRGRWRITEAGRFALRNAKPSVDQVMRRKQRDRERIDRLHQAHVELQRLMGLPEAMIQAPFDPTFGATVALT